MIGAARMIAGAAPKTSEQVLDHVDREELRVVALDAGHQGDRDAGEPEKEEDGPIRGDRVRRMRRG